MCGVADWASCSSRWFKALWVCWYLNGELRHHALVVCCVAGVSRGLQREAVFGRCC